MKIKEQIKNLQDIRRNFWVTAAAIIGGLAIPILNAKDFVFNWIFIAKLVIYILGVLLASFFINEVICCNKSINMYINKLKED